MANFFRKTKTGKNGHFLFFYLILRLFFISGTMHRFLKWKWYTFLYGSIVYESSTNRLGKVSEQSGRKMVHVGLSHLIKDLFSSQLEDTTFVAKRPSISFLRIYGGSTLPLGIHFGGNKGSPNL